MIHIYYGDGKGKTTASIGAGIRAKGAGMDVLLVQFFKNNKSSELHVLPFEVFGAPENLPFNPDKMYGMWVNSAMKCVENSNADVIILDEFLDLVPKFLTVEKAVELLSNSDKEYIITGHTKIDELFDMADYITEMQKKKHPYDSGIKARKGIEF